MQICILSSNSSLVFAQTNKQSSSLISSTEKKTLKNVISAKSVLEIADELVSKEKREQKKKNLIINQPFDLNIEKTGYYVLNKEESLTVSNKGIVIGEKEGIYELTVFYKNRGFINYTFDIRKPEVEQEIKFSMYVGQKLDLKEKIKNSELATYKSLNEDILIVSNDGLIEAKKQGEGSVFVTINDFQNIEYTINIVQTFPNYTTTELDLIYAIVQQECSTSYDGALAVISCAYNRSRAKKYLHNGSDPLSQLTAEGQFCYSLDDKWKRYLNSGTIYDYVKQAVYDCLFLGKTNHNFLSYRGFQIEGAIEFDGNFYFEEL
jgi:hypothetical protein